MTKRKTIGRGLGLAMAGYVAGILTAPRSGRRTRTKLKNATDPQNIEVELKAVYEETKKDLSRLTKEYPKLTERLSEVKEEALKSQDRLGEILKAVHGQSGADSDLTASLKEAKKALDSLKKYLSK